VWSKVIATGILAVITSFSTLVPAVREFLGASSPVPHWALAYRGAVSCHCDSKQSKPRVKITLIDVGDRIAETNIPFRLKVYCEMRNDSNRTVDVRFDNYISTELKVTRIVPAALQLKFQPGGGWSPEPSVERVAVLPGQTFRAWIAPDETVFNKAPFEWLRSQMGTGQMGTLVLNVDGQEIKIGL
jgi:hypothetical protein